MSGTFGNIIKLTVYGESHGAAVGAVLSGLPAGIPVDSGFIGQMLSFRRGEKEISTNRREADNFEILSGVFGGVTCGTPICINIENTAFSSAPYNEKRGVFRPSHADYVNFVRAGGNEDYRGGGASSGRLTAPVVAAGAILLGALKKKGIEIVTKIDSIGGVKDRDFCDFKKEKDLLFSAFPVLDSERAKQMKDLILAAKEKGDSIGGTLKTAVLGVPVGTGEPFFDSLESLISHAVFSIPAVKGIEFGKGFGFADVKGSEALDEMAAQNGEIKHLSNNNGGILGGFSNGEPIVFKTVIKPTPTIQKTVKTVTFNGENIKTAFTGSHDSCIVPRAAAAIRAVTAISLADALAIRYGKEWFSL